MIDIEDFNGLELRVGKIEKVELFPEANIPAYKLKINFGKYGEKWSSAQITENYSVEELTGRQIIAVMNLGVKIIAGFTSEVLVMGVDDKKGNVILLEVDEAIDNGVIVN